MSQTPITIPPSDLVAMDTLATTTPLRIDIVYAQAAHPENMFGEAIYRPGARLWLHKDFAEIVALAAKRCFEQRGFVFVLKDGLRTTEAQEKIVQTPIVRANPHWLQEPRLFSPPGKGGHPRAMAIDIVLETRDGQLLNMGTQFDYLTPDPAVNPAARNFAGISDEAEANRQILEDFMVAAAKDLNRPLLPLPAEWWDFRFPGSYTELYAPISDRDLPPAMRMTLLP
ncbi:MAG: D-alanyl-D-alanine dipeptidase [Micavibrio sp.]|nr:D-alanyl-D-alanine dipeptidase [Micavibrio sp.]